MNFTWIPNAITLARIFSAIPLAWLLMTGAVWPALILFLFAGLSDALDGWLARRFHWQSQLGGYLDPIADKALMLAAYVPLAIQQWLPLWLAALIVLRDLLIVAGAFAWHFLRGPLQAEPLLQGRINTVLQILLVLLVLLDQTGSLQLPPVLLRSGIVLVALSTLVSGTCYVIRWSGKHPEQEPLP